MAQLQHLDGRPQTWGELEERLASYWATHDLDGRPLVVPPVYSGPCAKKLHRRCDRAKARHADCTCWCHG